MLLNPNQLKRKALIRNQLIQKVLFIYLMLFSFTAYSQNSELGNWLSYFGNKSFKNNWNWHNEIQYRSYNLIDDLEQLLIRSGIGYNLSDNNNVLLGYGYILSQNYVEGLVEKTDVNEHRIFEQFTTRQNIGIVAIQHRYRFEQRFIDSDFRLRFRYFLSLNIPLNNTEIKDKTLYLSTYNEIFLNTTENQFDRNRLYCGLGYRFSPVTRIEIGYMNQFLPDTNRDQINIISFINF